MLKGDRSVTVPGDLIEDGLEHVDRHDANASFDQPPREQDSSARSVGSPYVITDHGRLCSQVEGISGDRLFEHGSLVPHRRNNDARIKIRTVRAGIERIAGRIRAPATPTTARGECRFPCSGSGQAKQPKPASRSWLRCKCAITEPKWGACSPTLHNLPVWRSWQPVS